MIRIIYFIISKQTFVEHLAYMYLLFRNLRKWIARKTGTTLNFDSSEPNTPSSRHRNPRDESVNGARTKQRQHLSQQVIQDYLQYNARTDSKKGSHYKERHKSESPPLSYIQKVQVKPGGRTDSPDTRKKTKQYQILVRYLHS